MKNKIKEGIALIISKLIYPNSKNDFLRSLGKDSRILDVGCGNNSSYLTKKIIPECEYTGIDIQDYNQDKQNLADKYIITAPESFSTEIHKFKNYFDAVISRHNLEHCNDREATLVAMLEAIKIGGEIYIAFPSEESVNFPKRGGTLNYYDDVTHKGVPPNFNDTVETMRSHGFEIIVSARHNRSPINWLRGLINERASKKNQHIMSGTWDYFGFESVIRARRIF